MTKFQEFLNSYKPNKNILIMLDSKNNFWELVKRQDLTSNILLGNFENLLSITSMKNIGFNSNRSGAGLNKFFCLDPEDSPKSKLLNIEIKENEGNISELDMSKLTELNFSNLIKDMNE